MGKSSEAEKRLKRQRRDAKLQRRFAYADWISKEYENKAVNDLTEHLNGFAECVEMAADPDFAHAFDNESEALTALLGSDAFVRVIKGAVEFQSSISTLKMTKAGRKFKKRHLRRHVALTALRRGELTQSALALWESDGGWAIEQFRKRHLDIPGWVYSSYIGVPYPKP